jgi:tRNA modification GTPase
VPALLLWMPAPHSFTGQDVAELLLPAHAPLVQRVLQAACDAGARLAHAGEFSARAFLAGRLSLQQAEGLAASIAAQTTQQLAAARSLRAGLVPYAQWYDEALTLLALVEAGIDFTDQEDVVAITPSALAARLDALVAGARAVLGAAHGAALPRGLPVVTLVGEPNAGKSTLFNALLRRPRAVMSPHAHTTRDVLREELDLSAWCPGTGVVALQDCPGLEAGSTHEGAGALARIESQTQARQALRDSDCVLWCDPQGHFDEARLAHLLGDAALSRELAARALRVRTCADRAGAVCAGEHTSSLRVDVSALAGTGLRELATRVGQSLHAGVQAGLGAVLPRHRVALSMAIEHLERARGASEPELVAADLRAGAGALGTLVGGAGTISPDEVLGKIFATFCVGK